MRIGVISDTHGHVEYTRAAVRVLAAERVEVVLHCGDIGSPHIVPLLADWPTHFVFGNVDGNKDDLHDAIRAAGQTCHEEFGSLELAGRRIALLHSHDRQRFRSVIENGEYDLVCYGHTHIAENHREGRTMVLNPGALFRATPHSIAVVNLETMDVAHVTVPSSR